MTLVGSATHVYPRADAMYPVGTFEVHDGVARWCFTDDLAEAARNVVATFGAVVPDGVALAARLTALLAAHACGARQVTADEVEGTGLVVDAGPYWMGLGDQMHACGFRATWVPYASAPDACWFQHDPGGATPWDRPDHGRECDCHACVEVCCCGSYARDHRGYDGHGFCGADSYARELDREATRKAPTSG